MLGQSSVERISVSTFVRVAARGKTAIYMSRPLTSEGYVPAPHSADPVPRLTQHQIAFVLTQDVCAQLVTGQVLDVVTGAAISKEGHGLEDAGVGSWLGIASSGLQAEATRYSGFSAPLA